MLVRPRRAEALETAHGQLVSEEICAVAVDDFGACRNPQTSIDCGQGVTVRTNVKNYDVELDPVDSIVDMAEVGV